MKRTDSVAGAAKWLGVAAIGAAIMIAVYKWGEAVEAVNERIERPDAATIQLHGDCFESSARMQELDIEYVVGLGDSVLACGYATVLRAHHEARVLRCYKMDWRCQEAK